MSVELDDILSLSVKHNASDLHISARLRPRIRVDGQLVVLTQVECLSNQQIEQILHDIYPDAKLGAFLQVDFSYEHSHWGRFRVNCFYQNTGLSIVMRRIGTTVPELSQLGVPSGVLTLPSLEQGLVLVTGPTGSGKSTTLSALIGQINQQYAKHILTIEDPIEFIYQSQQSLISQREVHSHVESFTDALKAALREDPDVILVGELRDCETIRLALTAAETGHLVFATLHTQSAAQTISRVVDVFPSEEQQRVRTQLAGSLQAVIAQRLLAKKKGGRVGCYELLIATPAVRNVIRENKLAQLNSLIEMGSGHGMISYQQSLQKLSASVELA
ncbi:type IV pilus twitching motility protein PilT [Vibrio sp. RC27]